LVRFAQKGFGSHEVEFIVHFFEGGFREALFGAREFLLFQASGAFGLVGEVAFAFEAGGGDAGEGVKHAQEVEGVGLDGLTEAGGADLGNGLGNERSGNFLGGMEDIDAGIFTGEVQGELMADAVFVQEAEFLEEILVTAGFPGAEAVFGESFAVGSEFLDDDAVGDGIEHHPVEAVADDFGEASDFAFAGGRRLRGILDFGILIFD
jgi:hypothetical protein